MKILKSGVMVLGVVAVLAAAPSQEVDSDGRNDRILLSENGRLGDETVWSFEGERGQVIEVTASAAMFDTVVELRPSGGALLASDDDSGPDSNSYLMAALPSAGSYEVRVTAYRGEASGVYEVVVRAARVRALAFDDPADGTIGDDSGAGEVWRFPGRQGQVASVAVDADGFDADVQLWSARGVLIAEYPESILDLLVEDADSRSRVVATLPTDGDYLVRVGGRDGGTGSYSLLTRPETVRQLPLVGQLSGELREEGAVSVWSLEGDAGDVVELAAGSDNFDTVLEFRSQDGTVLAEDDDGGPGIDSRLVVALPPDGPHYVWVTAAFGRGAGSYNIAARRVDRALEPDNGVWRFDGVAGHVVSITAESDAFDTVVHLVSPAGEDLAQDDDGGPGTDSHLVQRLSSTGRYLVRVTAVDGGQGPYEVMLHTVPLTSLEVGTTVDGVLGGSRPPIGIWEFDGTAGAAVDITATSPSFDTVLQVLSPTGAELARNDDANSETSDSALFATLPMTGRYQVRVTAYGEEGGSYRVAIRTVRVASRSELRFSESATGTLGTDELIEDWFFNGDFGQTIEITASSDAFDTVVHLLSPAGAELARDDDGGPGTDSRIVATLPVSGRYRVRIAATDAGAGRYEVAVARLAARSLTVNERSRGALD